MKIKTVGDLKEVMRGLPDDSKIFITSVCGDNTLCFEAKILGNDKKQLMLNTDFHTYTDEDLEDIYTMYQEKKDREAQKVNAPRLE